MGASSAIDIGVRRVGDHTRLSVRVPDGGGPLTGGVASSWKDIMATRRTTRTISRRGVRVRDTTVTTTVPVRRTVTVRTRIT